MNSRKEILHQFDRLLDIMNDLREKCPWDMKQTLLSLKNSTIEETYELMDAIDDDNLEEIKKELGDLILHIIFYSKIASETNSFDMGDVLSSISEKLIYRHPHIYGDTVADTEEEVKQNWEKLKLKEKGRKTVLEGVPSSLPSIIKAYRIQDKVSHIGFEFENNEQVLDKLVEEIKEFQEEASLEKQTEEFGDILFSLINYARFNKINPEEALNKTNKKFITRFNKLEELAKSRNLDIADLSVQELNVLWEEAKAITG